MADQLGVISTHSLHDHLNCRGSTFRLQIEQTLWFSGIDRSKMSRMSDNNRMRSRSEGSLWRQCPRASDSSRILNIDLSVWQMSSAGRRHNLLPIRILLMIFGSLAASLMSIYEHGQGCSVDQYSVACKMGSDSQGSAASAARHSSK